MKLRTTTIAAVVLAMMAGVSGLNALTQEQTVDTAKLFAEIAGDYDFAFEDQFMTIAFWVDGEKLFGAPRGQEDDYAEIVPVDPLNLKFEATTSSGQYFEISFVRDEDGNICKCILTTQGIELEGSRVKK